MKPNQNREREVKWPEIMNQGFSSDIYNFDDGHSFSTVYEKSVISIRKHIVYRGSPTPPKRFRNPRFFDNKKVKEIYPFFSSI